MPREIKSAGIGEFGGAPATADWGGSLTTMPLYWMYEAAQSSLGPARALADAGRLYFKNPTNPASHTDWGRKMGAMCEVFERATRRYGKPEFGLATTLVNGERVTVTEKTVWSRPFCNLVNFERAMRPGVRKQPKLLIVAPMSGHYATLLRGTVEAMLPDHDVFITDWTDARLVPVTDGSFDLDDYIDYLISIFHFMKGDVHVMAVCQPAVPVLAAVARMEAENDPFVPHSMTLMGGPIDTRENPTAVNQVAIDRGTEWFQRNVVTMVPWPHPGVMRQVYPGFLQLTGFVSMNLDRHVEAHKEFFNHLVDGDGDSAEKHREFYDEYLAVMDLTAEFYLQTVDTVFVRQSLPKGEMTHRGKPVDCSKITRCALMTVEGERDDISGVGQTKAAHALCSSLSDDKRVHYLQDKVGHYGVFNGSRFRSQIAPRIHDFILSNQPRAASSSKPAAPAAAPQKAEPVEAQAEPQATTGAEAAVKPRAAAKRPKANGGTRLAEPQGPADDLTRIIGVGPKLQAVLNEAGIFHYWQIARMTEDERLSLDAKMTPPGRIARDKWVEQAARLVEAG
ncbi:polyhydroxyalkanoate depolymerase [Methylopila sp. Yamaguchi]|uniref:polyhydroxyalkanoate depolymerase n=1 Tax=Methylopila sp. Yamaguchi TaxID=1437817 RepID=UPI000CC86A33|nr:polyhydroxyalkanoate depolymerase [Methylopila sp. Yamaguchi]GBD49214.1 polyhydroxyalkanoate depolymerase [Methylopila sp. Yamaguchi]